MPKALTEAQVKTYERNGCLSPVRAMNARVAEENARGRPPVSRSRTVRSASVRLRLGVLAVVLVGTVLGSPDRVIGASGPPGPQLVAQSAGALPQRGITVRGTVVGLEGARLRVATASGEQVVRLIEPLTVIGATRAGMADIVAGTFIGTAARSQDDGTFRALEVHIFPESMRGTGEGHRPWELPGTTMTNSSVDALVEQAEGPVLTLKHKDGITRVLVPPEAPIVRFGPGDASLIVPGASIVVFRAVPAEDGTLSASRITIGVNGTRLPM